MIKGHRLINSHFPPIELFDDVASPDEFDVAYAMQALVNPRLDAQLGNLALLQKAEIPFGIQGCSYAVAPFTHVNPNGSRFSDGAYGVLYCGDSTKTALLEVQHHQTLYWQNVPELKFDVFVFKELIVNFSPQRLENLCELSLSDPIYHKSDYRAAQAKGYALKKQGIQTIQYHSVRNSGAICWGLLSPSIVGRVIQSAHYEMTYQPNSPLQIKKITKAI